MNISSRLSLACALVIAPLAALGCNRATDSTGTEDISTAESQELASDGADASAASAQAVHVDNLIFAQISSSDPGKAAVQASVSEALYPASCVSRTQVDPTHVRLTFDDCTGPFGLVHLDGAEVATFSAGSAPGVLHVDLQSDGLTANGKSIDHHATADVSFKSGEIDVAWKGGWSHTMPNGHDVQHTSDLAIVVDTAAGCLTIDGSGDTTVGGRGVSSDIDGYRVCRDSNGEDTCPTGSVKLTSDRTDHSLTIGFDGSNKAEVTAGSHDFSVPLICGG